MAQASVATTNNQIVGAAVLLDLAEDVTLRMNPGIEDRGVRVFAAFTEATAVLITPPIEALAIAYRQACSSPVGREAARTFLQNMLDAED